jgi:hypothetical protein
MNGEQTQPLANMKPDEGNDLTEWGEELAAGEPPTNTSDEKATKQHTHEYHFVAAHLRRYGWVEAIVLFDQACFALQAMDEANRYGSYCEGSDVELDPSPRNGSVSLPGLSTEQIEAAVHNLIEHGAFLQRGRGRFSLEKQVLAEVHESQSSSMILVGAETNKPAIDPQAQGVPLFQETL